MNDILWNIETKLDNRHIALGKTFQENSEFQNLALLLGLDLTRPNVKMSIIIRFCIQNDP